MAGLASKKKEEVAFIGVISEDQDVHEALRGKKFVAVTSPRELKNLQKRAGIEASDAIEALNRFNEKQEASESSPLAAEIQQLADMKEKGLLTDEEYSAAKAKLLGL